MTVIFDRFNFAPGGRMARSGRYRPVRLRGPQRQAPKHHWPLIRATRFRRVLDTTCDISEHDFNGYSPLKAWCNKMTQSSSESAFSDAITQYVQRVTTDTAYAAEIRQTLQGVVNGTARYESLLTQMAVSPEALSQMQPDATATPEWSISVTTVTTATLTSPTTVTTTTTTTLREQ